MMGMSSIAMAFRMGDPLQHSQGQDMVEHLSTKEEQTRDA